MTNNNYHYQFKDTLFKQMSRKRIHPSFPTNQYVEDPSQKIFDDDLSEYECFRKRVKKDISNYSEQNAEDDPIEDYIAESSDLNLEVNNLYAQEFENLRACSFKTISKIGYDKSYPFIKNQVAQFDDKFSSSYNQKRLSLVDLSEEKCKKKEKVSKNMVRNYHKPLASFGSLNQISKLEKKSSMDSCRLNGMRNHLKKIEYSISGMGSGSMNSINTQMMNEMIDFTINDQNEPDQIYLSKMMETALIKNVRFSANLYIVLLQRNSEARFYKNIKMHKLLDVDGFSIKSLYAQSQKIRINLKKSITNKQFQRKFVFQPQLHHNIQASKQQLTKQNGVEFEGSYYDFTTHQYEEVKFYLSQLKDNSNSNTVINNDEIENINFENWMMPQDAFDCSFGFGNFMANNRN